MKYQRTWQITGAAVYRIRLYALAIMMFVHVTAGFAQDSSVAKGDDEEQANDSSGYNDSAQHQKHIYDTSKNFFNLKDNLNEPFTTEKVQSRVAADAEVKKLKEEDEFWYVKSIEKFKATPVSVLYDKGYRDSLSKNNTADVNTQPFSEEEEYSLQLPDWANWIIWGIIIAVFLSAVVYFLLSNKINIFSRSSDSSDDADGNVAADLFTIPHSEMLQQAYLEKNYRMAVRILYLQTLKMLTEKKIIHFKADYTNMHYLQQLSNTMFYSDFFAITRHYDYVWYGEFAVSEQAFRTITEDFTTIQDKVLHR